MTDTRKRPDWLPEEYVYNHVDFIEYWTHSYKCACGEQHHASRSIVTRPMIEVRYGPDCESAAREAIGGGE